MKKILKNINKSNIGIAYLIFITVCLRLVNLGYSDYQGDEIKAFYNPINNETLIQFLLRQRKGPIQFLLTYVIKYYSPDYFDNFWVRLPFAVAGIAAIYVFYKFVSLLFDKKIAIYSSILLSASGLFVAFSRIVQYQSYTILFSVLTVYLFLLAVKKDKWKIRGLYFGAASWALAMLSHYDGIFIFPFVLYCLYLWYKKNGDITHKLRILHICLSGSLSALILGAFYVPYVSSLSESTLTYWVERISDVTGKISSSMYTFEVYNPKNILYLYLLFFLSSLFRIKKLLPIILWALVPWLFMEIFTDVPGTHIYVYLIPVTVMVGHGMEVVQNVLNSLIKSRTLNNIYRGLLILFFVFIFLISYGAFVDHRKEYPWESKKFLLFKYERPNHAYHLSMFGFPYYRHWEEIAEYVIANDKVGYYGTNDRKSIPRYYLPLKKDGNKAGLFIYVKNPQSWSNQILQEKPYYWAKKYDPVKTFRNYDRTVVKIYDMPGEKLEDLIKQGY